MRTASETLEFNEIKKRLQESAVLVTTKERFASLDYSTDYYQIEEELEKTKEALDICNSLGRCPIEYIHNIYPLVDKAVKKGVLTPSELYHVSTQADGVVIIRSFFNKLDGSKYPSFAYYVNTLVALKNLKERIDACISPNFEVYDKASLALAKIRKEINSKSNEVRKVLENIVKNKASYLSDSLITIRNDRLVIPVKQAYKFNFGGIIHDESQSQQTAYIEPEGAVLLNAQIESLKQQELLEIERILRELSGLVAHESEVLLRNQRMIEEIDFMFAKGVYGHELDALVASLSKEQIIELKGARHPLIEKQRAVINDFSLGGEQNKILLISGPNTGGKTVALKTVGLLAIMNQSGLAIPCDFGATLGIFDDFYVDIGDEQSIEQSLSTFSSHMAKLTDMVNKASSKSLVLLDEIGGGTDPSEGEAIAMSALHHFNDVHSLVIATTHYSNLKTFAVEEGYITNASMRFDKENLKPTYKLQSGIAGHSYALEIASNLGYPKKLVVLASSYLSHYQSATAELMAKLEKELERVEDSKERIRELEAKQKELLEDIKKEKASIGEEKKKIKEEAQEEISKLVLEAMNKVEGIMEEIKGEDVKLHQVIAAKKKVEELEEKQEEKLASNEEFKVGDKVKVISTNKIGKITDIRGSEYIVDLSGLTLRVKKNNLEHTKQEETNIKPESKSHTTIYVSTELNVIGKHVDEALIMVDKYLDSAYRVHLKTVRIIHGFGSGALRTAIHKYLKGSRYVDSFAPGGAYDGGLGATIVTLKK